MYELLFKRFFDFIFALAGLMILSPVLLTVTLILSFTNQTKPFFFQLRPGKDARLFRILKFKTMNDKTDANGIPLADAQRLSQIGKLIRKTSLDEIPQLMNVLKGDMSLVGPRPLLPEYLPLYNEEQQKRHNVRPGITGWAQVNGRNAVSWQQKFEYDAWYIENQSFLLDMKILFRTIKKVFFSEGITGEGQATTSKFTGN